MVTRDVMGYSLPVFLRTAGEGKHLARRLRAVGRGVRRQKTDIKGRQELREDAGRLVSTMPST